MTHERRHLDVKLDQNQPLYSGPVDVQNGRSEDVTKRRHKNFHSAPSTDQN